jgi:outer membrane protein TolC
MFSSPDNTMAMTISLTQPIFAQGKVTTGLKIAKVALNTIKIKYEETKQTLTANVSKLYNAALLAQRNAEIQKEAIALATESHHLAVLRLTIGKGTELDTLVSRLNLEKALMDERSALAQKQTVLQALIMTTGVPATLDNFAISGELVESTYSIELSQARDMVATQNKKLMQLDGAMGIQKHLVSLAKSDYLPLVYCGGSTGKIYQFDKDKPLDWSAEGASDTKVFIGMSMKLFNGGQRMQKVTQARADERTMELTKEQAEKGLELATVNAYEALQTMHQQLEAVQSILALAQKGYDISKKAYEVGSITVLQFQDSELQLNQSKLAYNAALMGYNNAVIDMKVLTGQI